MNGPRYSWHCIKSLSLLATLSYSLTLDVYAQQQDVERVEIRRVRLPVTVLDKKEQPVIGLKATDFLILEDKKPQQIETFSDESGPGQVMRLGEETGGRAFFTGDLLQLEQSFERVARKLRAQWVEGVHTSRPNYFSNRRPL